MHLQVHPRLKPFLSHRIRALFTLSVHLHHKQRLHTSCRLCVSYTHSLCRSLIKSDTGCKICKRKREREEGEKRAGLTEDSQPVVDGDDDDVAGEGEDGGVDVIPRSPEQAVPVYEEQDRQLPTPQHLLVRSCQCFRDDDDDSQRQKEQKKKR